MSFSDILDKISNYEDLTDHEATFAMKEIISGKVNHSQTAAFLFGMRAKKETINELASFVKVMREAAVSVDAVDENAVDLCGTGGDHSNTFNISTAAMFVVAGAGIPVLKHGNRNISSKCGSADVLESLGGKPALSKDAVEFCFRETKMAFMFAPYFHPAMKHVMPVRKDLAMRTFFNLLGPLLNPAGVKRQVIGAYSVDAAKTIISILSKLGTDFAYTINANDGLDEFSTTANTEVFELKNSVFTGPVTFDSRTLGFTRVDLKKLEGGDAKDNAAIINSILDNRATEAQTEIVALNATFAIHASGVYDDLQEAHLAAQESIEAGKARKALDDFIACTNDAEK
ncbi:MAG: anthranilate phosphoribosyltransferase [Balneolales bacterium]